MILGLAPFKLRKKAGVSRLQLMYKDTLFYCDSVSDLMSNEWYHLVFVISEDPMSLKCYLNGESYSIGTNPVISIAQKIELIKEVNFGFTNYPSAYSTENKFEGYIKEFRFWNTSRTDF